MTSHTAASNDLNLAGKWAQNDRYELQNIHDETSDGVAVEGTAEDARDHPRSSQYQTESLIRPEGMSARRERRPYAGDARGSRRHSAELHHPRRFAWPSAWCRYLLLKCLFRPADWLDLGHEHALGAARASENAHESGAHADAYSFAFFKLLQNGLTLPFTPVENVLVQTVASSMEVCRLVAGTLESCRPWSIS
ncbi:hypothetical protein MRB53_039638 [Persea americana]|nr:hypothetical protein MRB53_039638 [Persea americana]